MTTDELRAKFEAHFSQPPYSWRFRLNKVEDICGWPGAYDNYYVECAWKGWQAAHASRDAEVESLRKDVERYRWIRNTDYEDLDETLTRGMSVDFSVSIRQGDDLDKAIDAAMREESK